MASGFTKKDLLVDMFAVGLTPSKPDFNRFVEAWIDNRFSDPINPIAKKNFINNFTSATRQKWKKKHNCTKAYILADKFYEAIIVFNPPKAKPVEPTVAAEPTQAGKDIFLPSNQC